mgnify:FL=1
MVIEANKTTNITRISTWDEGMLLHVQDSLVGLPELEEAPEGRLVDIGSGAGYPGIPLAIESGRSTLLADSVGKKTAILASMVQMLGLDNVEVYTGRIEDLAREEPASFAAVTARALAQLSILMEFASPLLQEGGRLICYKANVSDEELDHAVLLQDRLAMKLVSDRTVTLGENCRRIICFEKAGTPQVKLPRKTGLAQKRPL